jgi:probable addiction module antidote protein
MVQVKKTKKIARSIDYGDWLMKTLKDNKLAVAYLNNALEQCWKDEPESLELLLLALRNVIQANGGMAKISKKAGLGRESLYKTVSEDGNPEFKTIARLTHALGMELRFK